MMSKYEKMPLEELKAETETQRHGKNECSADNHLPTREDVEKRNEIYEKALEIGVNLMMTDDTGKDNYYRDLALLYIIEGKEVPDELREKIEVEAKHVLCFGYRNSGSRKEYDGITDWKGIECSSHI